MAEVILRCALCNSKSAIVKGMCKTCYARYRRANAIGGICAIEGCDKPVECRGLCGKHYHREQRAGTLDNFPRKVMKNPITCLLCDNTNIKGHGYCGKHYSRWYVHGDPTREPKRGCINADGYRVFVVNGERYLEHRKIMEDMLGRTLFAHENVHHINGDRLDNRIENLELWSTSQPSGQRVEDKIAWAKDLLGQYGYIVFEGDHTNA